MKKIFLITIVYFSFFIFSKNSNAQECYLKGGNFIDNPEQVFYTGPVDEKTLYMFYSEVSLNPAHMSWVRYKCEGQQGFQRLKKEFKESEYRINPKYLKHPYYIKKFRKKYFNSKKLRI